MTGERPSRPQHPPALSEDEGFPSRVEPAEGCGACGVLAQWSRYYSAGGDGSRATDCVVEIRNHPHEPPKLAIPEGTPPRR
ncbi:hypothetical protein [Streptomyces roseoviridis]|uniref:Uncharacterized protein n=1 Tax=Streptomyces roseoviridis TaxID=67361 RepID=A0ABV5QJT2_9ACTN